MRVLIGYDASKGGEAALDLARALAWPAGTQLRVIQVAQAADGMSFAGTVARMPANVVVDARIIHDGSAANVLLDQARELDADLIVVGHRGHGPMTTAFLGSVARDVAERAHCPVLIARRATCERIVLAEDGSEGAFEARRLLAGSPLFAGKQVRVVTVAQLQRPLLAMAAAAVSAAARADAAEAQSEVRGSYERLAIEIATELGVAGVNATAEVRSGDPAEQIVAAARETDADLVVMGTRSRGPVERMLLGSVARAVLLSAPCSVLVVRESHLG